MVYITGDCHCEFNRFSTKNFPEQKWMTRDDTMIICGDFGIWDGGNEETWWLNWLSKKSFTVVFIDGNHENFDRLYSNEFKIVDFHGGKAQKIKTNIYHLMRGEIYEFDGNSFWCFGGAKSHDIHDGILDVNDFNSAEEFYDTIKLWSMSGKFFRINHVSWWEKELPSIEEMEYGKNTLLSCNNKVDYIITHCPPQIVASMMGFRDPDALSQYFNDIAASAEFKRWIFGHLHREQYIIHNYQCIYERIERLL